MKHLLNIILLIIVIAIASCADDKPDGLLSQSEMEDVLYDMHLMQNVNVGSSRQNSMNQQTFRAAIFKKYEITEAQWDTSYNYYCAHADELLEIYEGLTERFQAEVVANGGDASMFDDTMIAADTANVWNREQNMLMMHIQPLNHESFSIKADTSYHAGDKFSLSFDIQYVFEDGMRDFVTLLAITLGNDSVISEVRHASQDGHYTISLSDNDHKGIKSIQGYFIIGSAISEEPRQALRLVCVSKIRLIRMHTDSKAYEEKLRQDSINNARRDSLRNAEEEANADDGDNHDDNADISINIDKADNDNNKLTNNEKPPLNRPKRLIEPMRTR